MINNHKLSFIKQDFIQLDKRILAPHFARFHRTKFSINTMDHLLIWLVVLYIYFSILLLAMTTINRLVGIKIPKGNMTLIEFLFSEVFPLALLAGFFSQFHHWIKQWSLIFWHDIKTNWSMIIFSGMVLFMIQIFLSNILHWFNPKGMTSSPNTAKTLTDVRQNNWLLIIMILIAPIFEELVFRFFLTNINTQIINKFLHIPYLSYGLGMLLSAFMFALLHDGWRWMYIIVYMSCALFLQFIQKKTDSLTAPVLVHGTNNLIVLLLTMI